MFQLHVFQINFAAVSQREGPIHINVKYIGRKDASVDAQRHCDCMLALDWKVCTFFIQRYLQNTRVYKYMLFFFSFLLFPPTTKGSSHSEQPRRIKSCPSTCHLSCHQLILERWEAQVWYLRQIALLIFFFPSSSFV